MENKIIENFMSIDDEQKTHELQIFSSHIRFDLWNIQFYIMKYLHSIFCYLSILKGAVASEPEHRYNIIHETHEALFNLFTHALSPNKYTPPIYLEKFVVVTFSISFHPFFHKSFFCICNYLFWFLFMWLSV